MQGLFYYHIYRNFTGRMCHDLCRTAAAQFYLMAVLRFFVRIISDNFIYYMALSES